MLREQQWDCGNLGEGSAERDFLHHPPQSHSEQDCAHSKVITLSCPSRGSFSQFFPSILMNQWIEDPSRY